MTATTIDTDLPEHIAGPDPLPGQQPMFSREFVETGEGPTWLDSNQEGEAS